jgi:hypothetical protein
MSLPASSPSSEKLRLNTKEKGCLITVFITR